MSRFHIHPRINSLLRYLVLGLAFLFELEITTNAMAARRQGQDIIRSLLYGLRSVYPEFILGIVLGTTIAIIAETLIINRKIPASRTPVDAGIQRWRRMRISGMGCSGLLLLFAAVCTAVFYAMGGGKLQQYGLAIILLFILAAVMFLMYWKAQPSREGLYAMETGDTSRVNDERMQSVMGKASYTTIIIFLAFMVFIALPYQAIATGHWPVESFVEIGILIIILNAATTYWNRRL